MRPKSFKTTSGYLTNMDNQIARLEFDAEREGKGFKVDDVNDLQRQSINNLLRQYGFAGDIKSDEKPYVGLERLYQDETDNSKRKTLDDILRWLRRHPAIAIGSVRPMTNADALRKLKADPGYFTTPRPPQPRKRKLVPRSSVTPARWR